MQRALLILAVAPMVVTLAWLMRAAPQQRADFVVASDELRTVDPQRVSWNDEIQVAGALFEGLTRLNPRTQQPEPATAQRWTYDPAALEYDFWIRPEARWSDGSPVRAADFRDAWLATLRPATQSQYASLLFVVAGASDYYRSRLDDDPANDAPDESVAVTALDDARLRVRLDHPAPYFLDLVAFPTLAPMHPANLRQTSVRARRENLIGNGAFQLRRWDFKRRLLLDRNPYYWDRPREPDAISTIEIYICGSPASALIAYETGRVDLLSRIEPEIARTWSGQTREGGRSDLHVGDRFATYFYRVNCARWPLSDARARQALSLAIDRQALCAHVTGLGETPAETLVPRSTIHLMTSGGATPYAAPAGLGEGQSLADRLARARTLLVESGYDARRPLELAFASDPPLQRRLAEATQAMWERGLGIAVELRALERRTLSQRIRDLDYDLARSDWYGDYLDPATFLELWVSGSGQNRTGWSNAEYDQLIDAAAAEADPGRRYGLLAQAERLLCERELPIIPLYFKRGAFLLKPKFTGVHDNPRDILPIHLVRRNTVANP